MSPINKIVQSSRLSQAREMIYDVFESDPNYLLCMSDSNFFLSRATDTSNLARLLITCAITSCGDRNAFFFRRSSRSFSPQRVQLPWCWIFNVLISCSSFHLHFSFHIPYNSYKAHQQVSPYVLSPPSHHHSAVKKQR